MHTPCFVFCLSNFQTPELLLFSKQHLVGGINSAPLSLILSPTYQPDNTTYPRGPNDKTTGVQWASTCGVCLSLSALYKHIVKHIKKDTKQQRTFIVLDFILVGEQSLPDFQWALTFFFFLLVMYFICDLFYLMRFVPLSHRAIINQSVITIIDV